MNAAGSSTPTASAGVTELPAGGPNALAVTLGLLGGDEWNLWILRFALLGGSRRYNDWLALGGGISNSVLSSRLAVLTAGGMLERREYQQNPPRHEYSVTRKGQSIWPVLITMWSWEKQWAPNETQPLPPLRHSTCGNDFTPILRCKECGEDVDVRSLDSQMGPSGGDFSRSVPEATSRRRSTKSERRPEILAHTMELVGNRWSAAIIGAAFRGARRYGEFAEITGAPPAIVADRLKHLTEIGVMETRPLPDRPQWSEYRLTAKGTAYFPPVVMCMISWGQRWFRSADGPDIVLHHKACGKRFEARLGCSVCGEELRSSDIEAVDLTTSVHVPGSGWS